MSSESVRTATTERVGLIVIVDVIAPVIVDVGADRNKTKKVITTHDG